jgi:hypothetical protein
VDPGPSAGFSGSRPEWSRPPARAVVKRVFTLLVAAVVLYGVAPTVLEVLGAYEQIGDVHPGWWIAAIATSAAGIWCMCTLQRLVLKRPPWLPTGTSQHPASIWARPSSAEADTSDSLPVKRHGALRRTPRSGRSLTAVSPGR